MDKITSFLKALLFAITFGRPMTFICHYMDVQVDKLDLYKKGKVDKINLYRDHEGALWLATNRWALTRLHIHSESLVAVSLLKGKSANV